MRTAFIFVKAVSVTNQGNGTFAIEIPSAELKIEEAAMIERLFPNTAPQVHKLLRAEMLLESVATEAEIAAPPPETRKSRPVDPVRQ